MGGDMATRKSPGEPGLLVLCVAESPLENLRLHMTARPGALARLSDPSYAPARNRGVAAWTGALGESSAGLQV